MPHAWYSYAVPPVRPVAVTLKRTLLTAGVLNGCELVQVLVPITRQRMYTEQLWSQEPTAFSRAE